MDDDRRLIAEVGELHRRAQSGPGRLVRAACSARAARPGRPAPLRAALGPSRRTRAGARAGGRVRRGRRPRRAACTRRRRFDRRRRRPTRRRHRSGRARRRRSVGALGWRPRDRGRTASTVGPARGGLAGRRGPRQHPAVSPPPRRAGGRRARQHRARSRRASSRAIRTGDCVGSTTPTASSPRRARWPTRCSRSRCSASRAATSSSRS